MFTLMDLHSCEAAETIGRSPFVRLAQLIQAEIGMITLAMTLRLLGRKTYRNIAIHANIRVYAQLRYLIVSALGDDAERSRLLLYSLGYFDRGLSSLSGKPRVRKVQIHHRLSSSLSTSRTNIHATCWFRSGYRSPFVVSAMST